jgi:antitoxin (DNA-binding transcriptional repressor) of toxin-antitoxin stability system
MATVAEFNLSDLVRNPTQVVEHVERGEEVILHRRGRGDLKLTLAKLDRDADSAVTNEFLARILSSLMERGVGREVARTTVAKAYPWLRFLTEDGQDECVQDLIGVALACASVRNYAAFHAEVASWRNTAEIYADPELLAILSGPVELVDHGRVPMPEVDLDEPQAE